MPKQYSAIVCQDHPESLEDCLQDLANEGGRIISVTWQPKREVVHDGNKIEVPSGYTVISEHDS